MDFKCSVRVQTAIEGIIYFTILIGVGLLLFAIWDFGDSEYNSFQLERTQAGSIQGKYIDSSGSAKSYYVTVRNGRYEADHEVSLVDYNAAKVGADFPIVPTDSDSVKMYGSGNAQKLVKETTAIVDQVASGLKDSTGVDLPSLLSGLLVKSDMDADPAEGMTD